MYIYVENPNLIEITLDVEQTDILKLSLNDPVSITLDVFPDDVFSGIISEISTVPVTNNGVSTYTVKVMFEKQKGKNIL
jgi:multidrug resistance efflux pump